MAVVKRPNLKGLIEGVTESVTIELEGVVISGACRPRGYSAALEKKVREADTNGEGLALLVAALMVSWDLTEDDTPDSPLVPLTFERLVDFPIEILSAVASAVSEKLDPNSRKTVTSSPSSS